MPHGSLTWPFITNSSISNLSKHTLLFILLILSLQEYYTNGIILHIILCDWLLMLSIIPLRPCTLLGIIIVCSFSLWSILWHGCNSLTIHSPAERQFLAFKLLWTLVCRFLCECKFPFLWDKRLRAQMQGHTVTACLPL